MSYFRDASPGGDETIATTDVVKCRLRTHDAQTWLLTAGRMDTGGDIDDDGRRTNDEG